MIFCALIFYFHFNFLVLPLIVCKKKSYNRRRPKRKVRVIDLRKRVDLIKNDRLERSNSPENKESSNQNKGLYHNNNNKKNYGRCLNTMC